VKQIIRWRLGKKQHSFIPFYYYFLCVWRFIHSFFSHAATNDHLVLRFNLFYSSFLFFLFLFFFFSSNWYHVMLLVFRSGFIFSAKSSFFILPFYSVVCVSFVLVNKKNKKNCVDFYSLHSKVVCVCFECLVIA
jgi:hypothetical protein